MSNYESEIKFSHLSIEDGLSQSSVNCILQDGTGFMWFGTQDGLNRYDGNKFTIYRNDKDDPGSLSDNFIYCLFEDSEKKLWIGTGNGVCCYDPDNDNFFSIDLSETRGAEAAQNQVRSVFEDSNNDLWIGTYGGGMQKFDKVNRRFLHFKNDAGAHSEKVTAIFEDSKKVLFAGTWGSGLFIFDRSKEKFYNYDFCGQSNNISDNRINCVIEDSSGKLRIGTNNGIYFIDENRKEIIHYNHNPDDSGSLSSDLVLQIYEDSLSNLWVATAEGGLNLFDPVKNIFKAYMNEKMNEMSLSDNDVMSVYEDRSGNIWAGTFGSGINKFYKYINRIRHYHSDINSENSLCSDNISCFLEDNSGNLWIGTYDGLNKLDIKKSSVTIYRHNPEDSFSLSNDIVTSIIEDKNNNIWVGTSGGGLNKLDVKSEKFFHYKKNENQNNSLSNDTIFCMAIDDKGILWIGTGGGGLNRYDPSTGNFRTYLHDVNDSKSISSNRVRVIFIDSKKNIWAGTDTGGMNKFDESVNGFKVYKNDPDDINSISDNLVLDILEDGEGNLWIGTMKGGLNRFNIENEMFIRFGEKSGLPNLTVNGILYDNGKNLWLSTNKGLSKFNPRDNTFKNYDRRDGFQSNEFNQGARLKLKNGELVFGGINGFNIFNPENIKDNPAAPQVVFTNFQIFNKDILVSEKNSVLKKSISQTEEITLTYYDSVFSFEFASLDFTIPDKNQYAYQMEGFDKDWVYSGERRFVTYTNLNPGEYILRVKGSNNDGVWNNEGRAIRIRITPPFWKTWWFKSIGALAFAGISGGIYQSRINKIKKEKKAQEEFSKRLIEVQENDRKRIAAELHDSIGHDLLITKNKLMLSVKNDDRESILKNINEVSEIISGTLKEVRQISYTLHPYQIERLGFAKAVLSIFERINKSAGLNLISNVDKIDGIFPPDVEMNLYRLIQECASNILKHSKATEVILNITKGETGISILLSDNGAGFNFEKIKANLDKHGLGLKGMSERAKLFGGKIEIKSSPGKGTTTIITAPFAV